MTQATNEERSHIIVMKTSWYMAKNNSLCDILGVSNSLSFGFLWCYNKDDLIQMAKNTFRHYKWDYLAIYKAMTKGRIEP